MLRPASLQVVDDVLLLHLSDLTDAHGLILLAGQQSYVVDIEQRIVGSAHAGRCLEAQREGDRLVGRQGEVVAELLPSVAL